MSAVKNGAYDHYGGPAASSAAFSSPFGNNEALFKEIIPERQPLQVRPPTMTSNQLIAAVEQDPIAVQEYLRHLEKARQFYPTQVDKIIVAHQRFGTQFDFLKDAIKSMHNVEVARGVKPEDRLSDRAIGFLSQVEVNAAKLGTAVAEFKIRKTMERPQVFADIGAEGMGVAAAQGAPAGGAGSRTNGFEIQHGTADAFASQADFIPLNNAQGEDMYQNDMDMDDEVISVLDVV